MADFVFMPQMGVSEESALLADWLAAEGDRIKIGQALFSLETGKSSFEELSKHEGVLLKILAPAGEEVAVGAPVAVIGQPGEKYELPGGSAARTASASAFPEPAAAAPAAAASFPADKPEPSGVSPRAKKLAAELGLDPAAAVAGGPEGRIIERDIKRLAASGTSPAAAGETPGEPGNAPAVSEDSGAAYEDRPLSRIRKVIAENMHRSLTAMAQLTLNASFDAARILALRQEMKESDGYGLERVTLNDFILFAVARTLPDFPDLNANLIGETMRRFAHVQLAVAVDTPRGLMVPVIRDADRLSLGEISASVREKAKRCRDGAVDPAELAGGSFTVSNLGAFGIESFTPVVNPPQTGILGVGGIQLRPRKPASGELEFYPAMGLSLTFDHRAMDGGPAAKFLKALIMRLEDFPLLLAK